MIAIHDNDSEATPTAAELPARAGLMTPAGVDSGASFKAPGLGPPDELPPGLAPPDELPPGLYAPSVEAPSKRKDGARS